MSTFLMLVLVITALGAALVTVSAGSTFAAVAFLPMLLATGIAIARGTLVWTHATVLIVAFTAWLVLTTLVSSVAYLSATTLMVWSLLPMGWLLMAATTSMTRRWVLITVSTLIVLSMVLAAIEVALGNQPTVFFPNRNNFGLAVLMALLFSAGVVFSRGSLRPATTGIVLILTIAGFWLIGLIGSRGVWLAALIALATLTIAAPKSQYRAIGMFLMAAAAGLLLAQIQTGGTTSGIVFDRVMQLTEAGGGDSIVERQRIWSSAIPLVREHPFVGTGLGTFSLRWAPIRHPLDSSAGWHAHNDYLQTAVEAGIPALLLIGLIMLALLRATWSARVSGDALVAWTAAALAGLATASMFSFGIQLPPLVLLAGLAAGVVAQHSPRVPDSVGQSLQKIVWLPGVVVALMLAIYAGTSLTGQFHIREARAADARGDFMPAYSSATRAIRWWPSSEIPRVVRADLLRRALTETEAYEIADFKSAALAEALADLDRAHHLNPYRPEPLAARAYLTLRWGSDTQSDEALKAAEDLYRQALVLRPRLLGARLELAGLLAAQGRDVEALALLMDGMRFWYPETAVVIEFKASTRALAERLGDDAALAGIPERLDRIHR